MAKRFYVLVCKDEMHPNPVPWPLNTEPLHLAEAKRQVTWQLRGEFGQTRDDLPIVTWDACQQAFVGAERRNWGKTFTKDTIQRGPYTEAAFTEFLASLAPHPAAQREPGTKRWRVVFFIDAPADADKDDVAAYTYDAVGTMHGCYAPPGARSDDDPGDAMWGLKSDAVVVERVTRARARK